MDNGGRITRGYDRPIVYFLTAISLLISLSAGYVKIYFWGGTYYASTPIKLGFWFIIIAGPLSLWFAFHKPRVALAVIIVQLIMVTAASV
jgi:hypothetical protein